MTNTLTNVPRPLKLFGAVLALTLLAAAALAVALTTGPAQAQTEPYPDPRPCGPGQAHPPEDPDATITSGHYAVFDGYWDFHDQTLNLNLCPPSVQHTIIPGKLGEKDVEVSTRTASNVDIRQTVIHLDGSDFEHTLTDEDVEEYDFFKLGDNDNDGVDDAVDQIVWWLKVDDPDTPEDEDSALAMGFSAALFDSDYWYLDDGTAKGAKPLQYEFEVLREPGVPITELGHVFAFDDSPAPIDENGDQIKTAYWDSSEVDANALPLYPGDYHHFQWAFTKPGTYVISVQLKGHVRQSNPHEREDEDYDENWEPISPGYVVTSKVRQYVFQIGPLTLNEEPAFQVARPVEEHSENDTPVGDPIPVYQGDDDPLTFTLTGKGHSLFSVAADSGGNAQIRVAGDLDYEVRPEYRLTLGVSDNKDREGNADDSVDSAISVRIDVTDRPEEVRSVGENSPGGILVGDAIVVPQADATTVYGLAGEGHELFTVERDPDNNAQIAVAAGATLNYEDAQSYVLTLKADTGGNMQSIVVIINVEDDPNEWLSITLTAVPSGDVQTVGSQVVFTGTVTGSPVATSQLLYGWWEHDLGGIGTSETIPSPSLTLTGDRVGTRGYIMGVGYEGVYPVDSNEIVIDWQAGQ